MRVESMDSTSEIIIALRAAGALVGLSQEELALAAGVSRRLHYRHEPATLIYVSPALMAAATRMCGHKVDLTRKS